MTNLHKELLTMYKNLNKEFKKNNVRFFAIGGTAIGAIRESGFVPWDDDMDFAIIEDDIPAFKKAVIQAGYTFKTPTEGGLQYFFKVYNENIIVEDCGVEGNLYIDFMIAQRKRKWSFIRKARYSILDLIAVAKRSVFKNMRQKENFFIAFGHGILKFLTFPLSRKRLTKKMLNLVLKAPISEDATDDVYWTYHWRKDEYYGIKSITYIRFEDTKLPVNDSFVSDVTHVHGDVTQRPPEKDRVNHGLHIKKRD